MKIFTPWWTFSFSSNEIYADSLDEAKKIAYRDLRQASADIPFQDLDKYIEEWEETSLTEWLKSLDDEFYSFIKNLANLSEFANFPIPIPSVNDTKEDYCQKYEKFLLEHPEFCHRLNDFNYPIL